MEKYCQRWIFRHFAEVASFIRLMHGKIRYFTSCWTGSRTEMKEIAATMTAILRVQEAPICFSLSTTKMRKAMRFWQRIGGRQGPNGWAKT